MAILSGLTISGGGITIEGFAGLPVVSSVEYLVVAGGGTGGYSYYGGGGGAGGYRTATGYAVTAESPITITIGAGGSPSSGPYVIGTNGTNSVFGSITSVGGGAGGSRASANGNIDPVANGVNGSMMK